METIEAYFDVIVQFFKANPHYGSLAAGLFFLILSYGNFKDYDWAVSPAGGRQVEFINTFGRKTFRICMGVITLLAGLLFIYGFYQDL